MNMGYNHGAELKNELASAPVKTKTARGPIPLGKHNGRITAVKAQTFTKGSYGVKITYTLEGKGVSGRNINEFIVLLNAQGQKTKYGYSKIKTRLQLALTSEALNNFAWPASDNEIGDFAKLLDAAVIVDVKEDQPYNGQPARRVSAVYPREEAA